MSFTFQNVVNLEGDLAYYNMLIVNYNFELTSIRNLLIKLENCPTSEKMGEICKNITETKEDAQYFLEEIENTSTELISNMKILDDLLEDYN